MLGRGRRSREAANETSERGGLLRDTLVVFANELRLQYRDGHVLISSLLLPLLLYPLIFWATSEFVSVGQGRLEKSPSRVGVAAADAALPIVRRLALRDGVQIVPTEEGAHAIRDGGLDVLLVAEPGSSENAGGSVKVVYDASRARSERARVEIETWIDEDRRARVADAIESRGGAREATVVFGLDYDDVATAEEKSGFLLGMLLPLTMVAMTSMGAFYPAIDVLVGERERRTLETIMSTGARRLALVAGKYLVVVAAALIAGALNLGSMLLTASQFLRSVADLPESGMTIPPYAIPLLLIGSLLLGGLLGAAMILIASLARTFREGQSLVTPFYTFAILPAMVTAFPGFDLSGATALVPVMNVALMMRGALQGTLDAGPLAAAIGSTLLLTGALLFFASWLFRQEDLLTSDAGGSLLRYLRDRARRGGAGDASEAAAR
jgi:sodium transport system permease protein